MRCEIVDNELIVIPDSQTEVYAITTWLKEHPLDEVNIDPFVHEEL